jgi:hypothetical protein
MDFAAEHIGFVLAAYGLSAAFISGLIGATPSAGSRSHE